MTYSVNFLSATKKKGGDAVLSFRGFPLQEFFGGTDAVGEGFRVERHDVAVWPVEHTGENRKAVV